MKNILLINPWVCDFALYDLWMRPSGLLRIGALLESSGYKVSYLDFLDRHHWRIKGLIRDDGFGCGKFYKIEIERPESVREIPRPYFRYGLPEEVMLEEIGKINEPDFIFITSGMTYWYPGIIQTVRFLKERFPGASVVLGGIYATLLPLHAKALEGVDYVITGSDLEEVSLQLSAILGRKIEVPSRYIYPEYRFLSDKSSLVVETSKGCLFNCSYCGSCLLLDHFIQREPEEVMEEIEFYQRSYDVKNIAFYDDALLVNAENHIIPILEGVSKKGITINFHTPNGLHARFIDRTLSKIMKESHFKTVRLSLETINQTRQRVTGGKVDTHELERAVRNLKQVGYQDREIGVYLMLGMPGQEEREVRDGITFLHSLKVRIILVSYSLVPRTSDERLLKEKGLISDTMDPLWHNNTIFPLIEGNFSLESIKGLRDYASSLNQKL